MAKVYDIGPAVTFTPLNTGEYKLTLKAWEEIEEKEDSQFSRKGDVKIQWTFEVEVPGKEHEERRVRTAIPASATPKAVMNQIIWALSGIDAETAKRDGYRADPQALLNKSCMGTIVRKFKEDNKTPTDSITAYAPLPGRPVFGENGKTAPESKLMARYRQLCEFAGYPVQELAGPVEIANEMRALGAAPMTELADKQLKDAGDLLFTLGAEQPAYDAPKTLSDGLRIMDTLLKALEAAE